jgi:glucose-1-phosphate adenylyltransferase
MNHIGIGKPWDLDRQNGGVHILQPYLSTADTGWYRGTADALFQNQDYIQNHNPKHIAILSGDQIYKMDYRKMLDFHIEKKAPVTIAVSSVSNEYARKCGVVHMDSQLKITDFEEKPSHPKTNLVNMGIYIFDTEVLLYKLQRIGRENRFDIVYHILKEMVDIGEVFGYQFEGYWRDIGTLTDFWQTNMDLISHQDRLNLYARNWVIHTTSERKSPVRFGKHAISINSLISDGSVINGYVANSSLFPGVHVAKTARITNSIIMHRSVINEGVIINNAILDKDVWIGADTQIGWSPQFAITEPLEEAQKEGLTIIGKSAFIPSKLIIGLNCTIEPNVRESDFKQSNIPQGSFIAGQG